MRNCGGTAPWPGCTAAGGRGTGGTASGPGCELGARPGGPSGRAQSGRDGGWVISESEGLLLRGLVILLRDQSLLQHLLVLGELRHGVLR